MSRENFCTVSMTEVIYHLRSHIRSALATADPGYHQVTLFGYGAEACDRYCTLKTSAEDRQLAKLVRLVEAANRDLDETRRELLIYLNTCGKISKGVFWFLQYFE